MPKITSLKKFLKNTLKKIGVNYYRIFAPYGNDDLAECFLKLGLKKSDNVFVHSSYDKFLGFNGKPYDVIKSIQKIIGETGTLLMPSMPFGDSAYRYISSGKKFDVRKTPSAMGLLTELFRRDPDTIRSAHPTHPILANGPMTDVFVANHEQATTPCGKYSPFDKLAELDGKILLLGTGIQVLTFFHYLEERFEEAIPRSPFTEDQFIVTFFDENAKEITVQTRLYDQNISRSRNLVPLEQQLKTNGQWQRSKLGALEIVVLSVGDIVKAYQQLIEKNIFCYDE